MAKGRIKWFDNAKGWGFIERENERDVFVHYTAIDGEGYKTLTGGEEVDFEVVDGPRGPQAQRVTKRPAGPGFEPAFGSPHPH